MNWPGEVALNPLTTWYSLSPVFPAREHVSVSQHVQKQKDEQVPVEQSKGRFSYWCCLSLTWITWNKTPDMPSCVWERDRQAITMAETMADKNWGRFDLLGVKKKMQPVLFHSVGLFILNLKRNSSSRRNTVKVSRKTESHSSYDVFYLVWAPGLYATVDFGWKLSGLYRFGTSDPLSFV